MSSIPASLHLSRTIYKYQNIMALSIMLLTPPTVREMHSVHVHMYAPTLLHPLTPSPPSSLYCVLDLHLSPSHSILCLILTPPSTSPSYLFSPSSPHSLPFLSPYSFSLHPLPTLFLPHPLFPYSLPPPSPHPLSPSPSPPLSSHSHHGDGTEEVASVE